MGEEGWVKPIASILQNRRADGRLQCDLESVSSRARAREMHPCMEPRFLATVAMHSVIAGERNAKVSPQTIALHRREDPNFETQVVAALAHAIELLHDVTMRSAIEGDCEPVFWQGIQIGHVHKFDNRLRIEMLRAHMPPRSSRRWVRVHRSTSAVTAIRSS